MEFEHYSPGDSLNKNRSISIVIIKVEHSSACFPTLLQLDRNRRATF